jgi:hypothetical protein
VGREDSIVARQERVAVIRAFAGMTGSVSRSRSP